MSLVRMCSYALRTYATVFSDLNGTHYSTTFQAYATHRVHTSKKRWHRYDEINARVLSRSTNDNFSADMYYFILQLSNSSGVSLFIFGFFSLPFVRFYYFLCACMLPSALLFRLIIIFSRRPSMTG